MPPTSFLCLWLRNDIHFAAVEGTQTTRFSIEMNFNISHLKGFQKTKMVGLGALTLTKCIRTVYLPPTTFLYLWLRNDIHFAAVIGTLFNGVI